MTASLTLEARFALEVRIGRHGFRLVSTTALSEEGARLVLEYRAPSFDDAVLVGTLEEALDELRQAAESVHLGGTPITGDNVRAIAADLGARARALPGLEEALGPLEAMQIRITDLVLALDAGGAPPPGGAPLRGELTVGLGLDFRASGATLPGLGLTLETLSLLVRVELGATTGAGLDLAARARGVVSFGDLGAKLGLPSRLPVPIPLPEGAARVELLVEVRSAGFEDGAYGLPDIGGKKALIHGRFAYELDESPGFWGFEIGPSILLEVFALAGDPAEMSAALAAGGLVGAARLGFRIRLPALPDLGPAAPLSVRTGDASGWISVRLLARASSAGDVELAAEIEPLGEIEAQLPGLPQPEPPLRIAVARAAGRVAVVDGELEAELLVTGGFTLRAPARLEGPPFAEYVEAWLGGLAIGGIVEGKVTLGATPSLELRCLPEGAAVAVDVLGVLQRLASGMPSPPGAPPAGGASLEARAEFGFALDHIALRLAEQPSFRVGFRAKVPGRSEPFLLYLGLTQDEAAIGLEDVRLPLWLPRISRRDFVHVAGEVVDPRDDAPRIAEIFGARLADPEARARYDALVEILIETVEAVTAAVPSLDTRVTVYEEDDGWHVRAPAAAAEDGSALRLEIARTEDTGELALAAQVAGAWMPLWIKPSLHLRDFSFRFSLRNPRDVRVQGSASLGDFQGPLAGLNHLALRLGLSADLVFFAAESSPPAVIEVPPLVPGYDTGRITFGKFLLGFGYPTRSFAVAFEGALDLPPQLVDDLDTSGALGAGVRLPVQSKLRFRFDVTPFVAGKVVIPIPSAQFEIDLRRDVSPGLLDARTCEPFWDGLQVVVPGLVRVSLKRITYSPLLALANISNSDFDGDLVIGDDRTGVAILADNVFWAYGIDCHLAVALAVPKSVPFWENFCVKVRAAGFGLHFNLQHPIPTFSPLAIFEMLALAADPIHYEVNPNGELANMMRASLAGPSLDLPGPVRRLFPGLAALADRRGTTTVNLETYISLLQRLGRLVEPLARALIGAIRERKSPRDLAQAIEAEARRLRPAELAAELLGALPLDLRRWRAEVDLGGFQGSALLALVTPQDLALGAVFQEPELEGFVRADLDALAPAEGGALLAARLRVVFTTRRIRFLGWLGADGSFHLVSQAELPSLRIPVQGLERPLSLSAAGSLELAGEAGAASLRLTASSDWNLLPGLCRLRLGGVRVEATSAGRFTVSGSASGDLFGGACTLEQATVDVRESGCAAQGRLVYRAGQAVSLSAQVSGRIGPGRQMRLAGAGRLQVLGLDLAGASFSVGEQGAAVEVALTRATWHIAGVPLAFEQSARLRGHVRLESAQRPELELEAAGRFSVAGVTIEGALRITARGGPPEATLSGRILWQDREWLGARVRLAGGRITLEGHTSLVFTLKPGDIGGVKVAGLFARLELGGRFVLDTAGTPRELTLDGTALVGILDGTSGQTFPVATARFSFPPPVKRATTEKKRPPQSFRLEIVRVRGLGPIRTDLPDLELPKPDAIEVRPSEQGKLEIPTFTLAGGRWSGPPRVFGDANRPVDIFQSFSAGPPGNEDITTGSANYGSSISVSEITSWAAGKLMSLLPSLSYTTHAISPVTGVNVNVDWDKLRILGKQQDAIRLHLRDLRLDTSSWVPPTLEEGEPFEVPTRFTVHFHETLTLPTPKLPSFALLLVWSQARRRFELEIEAEAPKKPSKRARRKRSGGGN